jgi:outer membrane receptor protein involved in Fe transport
MSIVRSLLVVGACAPAMVAYGPIPCALAAVAANETTTAATSSLDDVVVTANRHPEPLSAVAASVSVVDRQAFETRADRFIGEEVRGLPGVLVRTNDQGTYTDIVLRGIPNRIHNDTLIALLDGVPYVTGDDEVDLEQLPFNIVGRVDLIRGPASALYGRGAIAGAIHYQTRDVGDRQEAHMQAQAGSYGFQQAGFSLQQPLADWGAALIAAQKQRSDGWRDRTGLDSEDAFLKQRLDLKENIRLDLSLSYVNAKQRLAGELPVDSAGRPIALPGGRKANWNEDDAGFYKRMLAGTAILSGTWSETFSTITRLHARQSKTKAVQGFFLPYQAGAPTIDFTGFRVDADTDTSFMEQQANWQPHPGFRLIVGASHEHVDARHIETWTGEIDPFFYAQRRSIMTGQHINKALWQSDRLLDGNSDQRNSAGYAQAEADWHNLTLSLGGRFDRFDRQVYYGPSGSYFGPAPTTTIKDADQRLSPKASLRWNLGDRTNAYVSYSEGFSPGFGPVWSFRNRDTALQPELAHMIETGLKGDLFDGTLAGTIALYQIKRQDLLQLLPVGASARTINSGRQRSQGIEITSEAHLDAFVPGLSLHLAYSLTDAEWTQNAFLEPDTNRSFDFTGKKVAGVPRHMGRAEIIQNLPETDLRLNAWADFSGDYPYDGINSRVSGGYAIINAALSWQASERLELTFTVRNLADRAVNTIIANNDGPFASFPQPPRQWTIKVDWRF